MMSFAQNATPANYKKGLLFAIPLSLMPLATPAAEVMGAEYLSLTHLPSLLMFLQNYNHTELSTQ